MSIYPCSNVPTASITWLRWNTYDTRRPACVIVMIIDPDALAPNRHQGSNNNQAKSIVVMVSYDLYRAIRIVTQPSTHRTNPTMHQTNIPQCTTL